MVQTVAPPTEQFYSVSQMIRDLKAGKFNKPNLVNNVQEVVAEQPAELYPVGTRIFCRFLQMEATVVTTTEHRIRVEWAERMIKGCPIRRGWLFREDCEPVETKTAENAAEGGSTAAFPA